MSIQHYYNTESDATLTNECNAFRAAAIDTWHRIRFSRSIPRLRIHETTITQNLVYELNLLKSVIALNFEIYESDDEKANGDDLEITVKQSNNRYLTFAVQSKIIYHNMKRQGKTTLIDGKYHQLEHYVGKGASRRNQVDLLEDYARQNGYVPLYLLYNYVAITMDPSAICGVNYDIKQYGCSLISTKFLRTKFGMPNGNIRKNVRYTQLHPRHALPWFLLVCCFPRKKLQDIYNVMKFKPPDWSISPDNPKERRQTWRLLSNKQTKFSLDTGGQNDDEIFNPKFLISIDVNKG